MEMQEFCVYMSVKVPHVCLSVCLSNRNGTSYAFMQTSFFRAHLLMAFLCRGAKPPKSQALPMDEMP